MKTYKGFDKDLKCRGFQYEIGKEYEEKEAVQCNKGFHACEHPLDVFNYYPPCESRYCEVEQDGEISKGTNDTKVASTKIKIGAEIGIKGLISAAVNYTKNHCTNNKSGGYCSALTGGDRSALTGGDCSALTGGDRSALTGGSWSALTGGDNSALTGGSWSALTGGDCSALTGGYKSALTGGDRSALTGGNSSALTGGNSSALTGGSWSALTGGNSSALTGGNYSVVYGNGSDAKVRGGLNSVLVLAEYDEYYNFVKNHCRTVDGKKIKENTYYTLKNGRFSEAK